MLSRRSAVVLIAAAPLALPRLGRAATSQLIDDWSRLPLGVRGVPAGWRPYATPGGHAAYDFTIVDDGGRRALELKSHGDHSTIAKEATIDLTATPLLEWSWRVMAFPAGADLRRKETSDAAGHLLVVWPRVPALLRSRLIGYVWDPALPVNSVVASRKTGTVSFLVVRSGTDHSAWQTEQRDVAEDYRRIFREEPSSPRAVALSIDTNDTRSSAATRFGKILFRSR
jgi:hypothetical protein